VCVCLIQEFGVCYVILVNSMMICVDEASLQNVLNSTRIFINPDVVEAVKFKEGYVYYFHMIIAILFVKSFVVTSLFVVT